MKALFDKLLPKDRRLPIFLTIAAQLFCYYLPKLFYSGREAVCFAVPADARIPFVPFFILFYVLAFVQWVVNFLVIAREDRTLFRTFIGAELMGKLICMLFFIVLPSFAPRPEITGSDLFSKLAAIVFFFDVPNNVFPSLHCFLSWLDMRAMLRAKRPAPVWKVLTVVFTLGVVASTLLVKQHVIWDSVAGIALAELVLFGADCVERRRSKK